MQRVEEEARRRVVVGFFDTIYWQRQFRRYLDRHSLARVTEVPNFAVPEIIVDDEDQSDFSRDEGNRNVFDGDVSPLLSPVDAPSGATIRDSFTLSGAENRLSSDLSYRGAASSSGDRHRRGTDASATGSHSSLGPYPPSPTTLAPHRPSGSAYSFDMDMPPVSNMTGGVPESRVVGGGEHSRRGSGVSAVSAENVLEVFQDSAWGESLRKSYTQRRSKGGAGNRGS